MVAAGKAAVLLALGICASIVLVVNAQAEPGTASFKAHTEALEFEDTASEDLDLATLWKKAVKTGKCIYKRKLVACKHDKGGDYGYGSDSYAPKGKNSYKLKDSYTKKRSIYATEDTPDYSSDEDADRYDSDSDSYSDSGKYKSGSAGKKKGYKKAKEVVEDAEDDKYNTTEDEYSTGEHSGYPPAPTPGPKKHTYSTKNKKKDSYEKKTDAYGDDDSSHGGYGASGEDEEDVESNKGPAMLWDYGWGGSYSSRPYRPVERYVHVPKHAKKGKWHSAVYP